LGVSAIQPPTLIKVLNKLGTEGTYLKIIKGYTPKTSIILGGEKIEATPLKSTNSVCSPHPYSIDYRNS
jgi:hypothetical protein